ncbi:MAG: hypothetical protein M0036_25900 [Desulfobacteraceae bacterium]|nr:hypothetical protein [Desulfobacteraceae bacterium]
MEITKNLLSELTGLDRRTIKKRLDGLQPIGRKGLADAFDSSEALKRIYAPMAAAACGLDPRAEKARLDKLRGDHQALVNAEKAKVLAPVSVTAKIIADIAVNTRAKVLGIPSKIAAILPAELRADVFKDCERLVKEILSDLAAYVPEIPDQDPAE